MKDYPIYYKEVKSLLFHLSFSDDQRLYHELEYDSLGMFREHLRCLDKLLSAYVQVFDDLEDILARSE